MFIEIRKQGKKKKYYLSHTYRVGKKVKKIVRFLGSDLTKKQLERLEKRAEKLILEQIKERSSFDFELSKDEIEYYKKVESRIEIKHLQKNIDWERFSKEFTYNTNAIEGSTVKFSEVKNLLDKKEAPQNSDEVETINVANAVEYIRKTKEKFSFKLIIKIHKICFEGTKHFAGQLRNVEVVIRDGSGKIIHQGAPAKKVKGLLKKLVEWFDKHEKKYPPLLLAALVHNQFEHIHPFQDGNGRVGRFLLNYILLKHDYPPINIRFRDRQKYYQVLREFDKTGDIKPTLRFLISQYKKQTKK